uniref:OTU deubiquitinase, ubiquitin aldehyde binding 1 n=1 Tax=Zosterops lateralis melanops TaxID=1220523 RepID=A0A8D2QMZ3_ZOSLA
MDELYKEYAEDDHVYQEKIKDLLQKYSYIRKTRPDGNCFYRAFGFAHLEALLEDGQELQRSGGVTQVTHKCDKCIPGLMELIERVERRVPLPELLAAFNEPATSDYLVVYLRLLTSGCLQRHRRFFEQFLEGGRSIKEFCMSVTMCGVPGAPGALSEGHLGKPCLGYLGHLGLAYGTFVTV